jgi:hypothetical protein
MVAPAGPPPLAMFDSRASHDSDAITVMLRSFIELPEDTSLRLDATILVPQRDGDRSALRGEGGKP